jgi:hypothetical protein
MVLRDYGSTDFLCCHFGTMGLWSFGTVFCEKKGQEEPALFIIMLFDYMSFAPNGSTNRRMRATTRA